MDCCEIRITAEALDLRPPAFSGSAGAVVDFYGVVRELEGEQKIEGIDYEAFLEMAEVQLKKVAEECGAEFSLSGIWIHHRIGFVAASEPSLFLRVSAGHRGPALAAVQAIVERLKSVVPIWKHPVYAAVSAA